MVSDSASSSDERQEDDLEMHEAKSNSVHTYALDSLAGDPTPPGSTPPSITQQESPESLSLTYVPSAQLEHSHNHGEVDTQINCDFEPDPTVRRSTRARQALSDLLQPRKCL